MSSAAAAKNNDAAAGTKEVDHIAVGRTQVTLQAQRATDERFQGMQEALSEFRASLTGCPEVDSVQLGSLGCPSDPRSATVFVVTLKNDAPAELLAQWYKAHEPLKETVGIIFRNSSWTSSFKCNPAPV